MMKKIGEYLTLGGWLAIFIFFPLGNTSLGLLLLLLGFLFGQRYDFKTYFQRIEYKFILAFSLAMIISAFFAVRPKEALLIAVGQSLIFMLVFYGAEFLVKNKDRWRDKLLLLLVISSGISGLITLTRFFTTDLSWIRARTLFTGINATGTVLMASIAMGIAFIYQQRCKSRKVIGGSGVLLSFGGMLATLSRGAQLGFITMMTTYLVRSKKGMIIFLVFIILVIAGFYLFFPEGYERLISTISLEKNADRLLIWQACLDMSADNFWIGVGPGMFASHFPPYRPAGLKNNVVLAHNLELQVLTEFGIIGFIPFIALLGFVLMRNIQLIKMFPNVLLYRGMFGAILGYLVHNQFDGTMVGVEVGTFFWVLCAWVLHEYYSIKEDQVINKTPSLIAR